MASAPWPKIGNDRAVSFLEQSLQSGRPAQAYAFIGADDLGKSTLAVAFARRLQGNPDGFNTDLHVLEPEAGKKNISIEQVREFIKSLNLSSFSGSYKIGIVKQADKLTLEAANALLKTLEEPKDKVIIILLAPEESSLLPTIVSRSQILHFQPVAASVIYDFLVEEHGAGRSLAKDLSNLSLGRPLKALAWLEDKEAYQEYLARAEKLLSVFGQDANGRLRGLDELVAEKGYGPAAVNEALDILATLDGIFRDLLILSLGQPIAVQHAKLEPQLKAIQEELFGGSSAGLLEKFGSFAQARHYLAANVSPRLVLEQVMINL